MIRRISIWGAPGTGKSVLSAWLFASLKIAGYNIQFVEEQVKKWAFQKRPILSFDQMFLTASQVSCEDELLRSGVPYIITDCPIMISYFYSRKNNLDYAPLILDLGRHVEKAYPSLNILLERDVPYQTQGRYETEEQAKTLDVEMLKFLKEEYNDLIITSPRKKEELLKVIMEIL
jgi:nicotinamide riboside kinase